MTAAAQNLNPVHLILELLNLTTWAVAPHHASIIYNFKKISLYGPYCKIQA